MMRINNKKIIELKVKIMNNGINYINYLKNY